MCLAAAIAWLTVAGIEAIDAPNESLLVFVIPPFELALWLAAATLTVVAICGFYLGASAAPSRQGDRITRWSCFGAGPADRNVRWMMGSLARLSQHCHDGDMPRWGSGVA
jgi:hypothetical protein